VNIAVIPARGGSRRVPRKNIRPFAGKPMMAWAIEAALASGCFERVLVSTDDGETAGLAAELGAQALARPASLADDHTGTAPVVAHAIEWCRANGGAPASTCCLYATAAFVEAADLREGLRILDAEKRDFVLAVTQYAAPIQRALRLAPEGLAMLDPAQFATRSQDLEAAYHDAGQFCWGRSEAWLDSGPLRGGRTGAVVLPRHRVQDIDTPEDWTRAEAMFRVLRGTSVGIGEER
jgi:N-acylneuraminate cytidylyltransferase